MDPLVIIVAIAGGVLAGIINTLAGNGSVITLTILTELIGLPGNLANGTNRIGILAQGMSGTYSFARHGKISFHKSKLFLTFTIVGALMGVALAVNVTNEQFKTVFKYLLLFMLFTVIIKPKRWLHDGLLIKKLHPYFSIPIYLMLGFYGGFIQMGMGVAFLIVAVLLMNYKLIEANALKTVIVFMYTIIVVLIFQWKGLIEWEIGLIIAFGQMIGGYVAAEFASKFSRADVWAYRLLILVIVLAIMSTFDLL